MKPAARFILFTFIILAGVVHAACRRGEEPKPAQTGQTAACPKLDGAYFTADKSTISPGDVVNLEWRIPPEYERTMEIAGLPAGEAPTIESFKAGPSSPPLPSPERPAFYTGRLPAKPVKTQAYTLKAAGPPGCQPLELPLTVTVTGTDQGTSR